MVMTHLVAFAIFLVVSPSTSTLSVTTTKQGRIYTPGQLIFEDNFRVFNKSKWKHEVTMSGGGNWEFEAYQADPANSYVRDGKLFIKPTLTACQGGESFLTYGTIEYGPNVCTETDPTFYPCERQGFPDQGIILPPIQSARLNTKDKFSFTYGRVEVRAKIPSGDYLWPAIWMLPEEDAYGQWPASGEIDIMESRGNRKMMVNNGNTVVNIGTEQISQTLHWGPNGTYDGYAKTHFEVQAQVNNGYDRDFHVYGVVWSPSGINFTIDNVTTGQISPPSGGFWTEGGFNPNAPENPWKNGTTMAPFDKPFYLILNLAVGGTNGFFPDDSTDGAGNYAKKATWSNTSPTAAKDFWAAKETWYDNNWMTSDIDPSLQIDYVRVYAI